MPFKLDRATLIRLSVIVAATFLSFGIVMQGFFIADDTWQLQFAYRVFHGEWWLVTGNFLHSYLGLPSMDFYRPLLGITYLLNYALYGTAAWGYYLTNILLAALAGIILYFIIRRILTLLPITPRHIFRTHRFDRPLFRPSFLPSALCMSKTFAGSPVGADLLAATALSCCFCWLRLMRVIGRTA